MTSEPLNFDRPAPYVLDPKIRIEQLKEFLSDEKWQFQKKNILKLINMYETGELGGPTPGVETWLKDGQVLDHEPGIEEITKDSVIWGWGKKSE